MISGALPAPGDPCKRPRMASLTLGREARSWLVALAVFSGAIGLLYSPALSPRAQFLYRDSGRMHHPVKRIVAAALAEGRLPQWNPYDGMGAPMVADPIHAVQHPFNAFLLLLPFEAGFKAWILASCLAAALGAFALARALGAGRDGGLAAGLAFALSGFVVSSTDNLTYLTASAFLPWVLAAGIAFVREGRPATLLALLAASWCSASAGDPVAWGLAVGFGTILGVALADGERRRAVLRGAIGFAAGVAAGAPVLAPLLSWVSGSARADQLGRAARSIWNLHPARLLEFAIPHLSRDPAGDTSNEVMRVFAGSPPSVGPWVLSIYVGVTVLLLAWAAASAWPARVLIAAAAVMAWAALGPYAGFTHVAERLPLLSVVRYWEKLAIWPTLFLSVAAGLGAGRVLTEDGAARSLARRGGAVAVALGLAWGATALLPIADRLRSGPDSAAGADLLAANLADGTLHATLLAGLLAAVAYLLAGGRLARLAPAALLLAIFADLLGANVRAYRVTSPPEPLATPSLGSRIREVEGLPAVVTPFGLRGATEPGLAPWEAKWRRGARGLYSAWNAAARVRNAYPYSALQPRRYATFDRKVPLELRVAALGTFGFQSLVVSGDPDRMKQTALPPPWEVLARDDREESVLVAVPHRPRAYLASEVRSVTPEGALAFAADPRVAALRSAVVEAAVPPGVAGGDAVVVRDEAELVTVRTSSTGPSLLVLNDAWAEGWSATVDGRPSPIHPANYAARGVFVEAGVHEVAFTYRTPMLAVGWAIAGAAALGAAAFALLAARRARRAGGAEGQADRASP